MGIIVLHATQKSQYVIIDAICKTYNLMHIEIKILQQFFVKYSG